MEPLSFNRRNPLSFSNLDIYRAKVHLLLEIYVALEAPWMKCLLLLSPKRFASSLACRGRWFPTSKNLSVPDVAVRKR